LFAATIIGLRSDFLFVKWGVDRDGTMQIKGGGRRPEEAAGLGAS